MSPGCPVGGGAPRPWIFAAETENDSFRGPSRSFGFGSDLQPGSFDQIGDRQRVCFRVKDSKGVECVVVGEFTHLIDSNSERYNWKKANVYRGPTVFHL